MAFSEFYMTGASGASNLNAGSTASDAADVTSTNGDWGNAAANRFTAASGTPFSGVSTGQWASVYLDAATSAVCVAQITAVNAGGASIDLSTTLRMGTAPSNNATGRSCKVGGAWKNLTLVDSLFVGGTLATPTRVNIKAGTYARTSSGVMITITGTTVYPLAVRGYKTSIGDQDGNYAAVAGTDIPSITFTTGQLTLNSAYGIYSNLDISGATTSLGGLVYIITSFNKLIGIRCTNTAANSGALAISTYSTTLCVGCNFTATTTAAKAVGGYVNSMFMGCVVTGGIIGILESSGMLFVDSCIFSGQAGDAIQVGTNLDFFVCNSSFYSPLGHGIVTSCSSADWAVVMNNYFEGVNQASKYAITNTSGTNTLKMYCVGNAYYNCTGTINGVTETFAIFDGGTLGASGFINAAGGNFGMTTSAMTAGFPANFDNVSAYSGYGHRGAVIAFSAGGGLMVNPGMSGGLR